MTQHPRDGVAWLNKSTTAVAFMVSRHLPCLTKTEAGLEQMCHAVQVYDRLVVSPQLGEALRATDVLPEASQPARRNG